MILLSFVGAMLLLANPSAGFSQITGGGPIIRTSRANVRLGSVAYQFKFTTANDAATNATDVSITVVDGTGAAVPNAPFDLWLSDATTGLGLTVTTASGSAGTLSPSGQSGDCDLKSVAGVAAGTTANGACISIGISKKAWRVQGNSAGMYVLQILDTAKTLFKVCAASPLAATSCRTLITADYK